MSGVGVCRIRHVVSERRLVRTEARRLAQGGRRKRAKTTRGVARRRERNRGDRAFRTQPRMRSARRRRGASARTNSDLVGRSRDRRGGRVLQIDRSDSMVSRNGRRVLGGALYRVQNYVVSQTRAGNVRQSAKVCRNKRLYQLLPDRTNNNRPRLRVRMRRVELARLGLRAGISQSRQTRPIALSRRRSVDRTDWNADRSGGGRHGAKLRNARYLRKRR